MKCGALTRAAVVGGIGLLIALASPSVGRAGPTVDPGFDLFETLPGTTFMGIPFMGVPLGSFDFGGSIGVQSTGTADTIVQRKEQATIGDPTIEIEMVALQLMSVSPVDLDPGPGFDLHALFVTLQSERGGPASTGEMTMDGLGDPEPHVGATFDSFFDVFFDLRVDSLDGPIIDSDVLRLEALDVLWGHLPPPGALEIPGMNAFLNGVNRDADFWPPGPFEETKAEDATRHRVQSARPVPAPSALILLGAGVGGLTGVAWMRRHKLSLKKKHGTNDLRWSGPLGERVMPLDRAAGRALRRSCSRRNRREGSRLFSPPAQKTHGAERAPRRAPCLMDLASS
jgi:hypothetical protein